MNDIVAITLNWLTARRTLGAVKSIKKYYPKMPLYIIDDGSDEKDKGKFFQVYRAESYRPEVIYDPDTDKLEKWVLDNVAKYIQVPTHRRHGEAIDYAMKHINSKWIFHIDSDTRLIKPGVIEYMMKDVDDTFCTVGIQRVQNPAYPQVSGSIFLCRQDLYKQYDLKMKPIYDLGLGPMTAYNKFLTDHGHKIKFLDGEIKDYYVHLRYEKGKEDEWNKYY